MPDDLSTDLLCIRHRLIDGHIPRRVLLMHTPKYSQIGSQSCPCSFTAIAMYFSHSIPVQILRPLSKSKLILRVAHAVMNHAQLIFDRAVSASSSVKRTDANFGAKLLTTSRQVAESAFSLTK